MAFLLSVGRVFPALSQNSNRRICHMRSTRWHILCGLIGGPKQYPAIDILCTRAKPSSTGGRRRKGPFFVLLLQDGGTVGRFCLPLRNAGNASNFSLLPTGKCGR